MPTGTQPAPVTRGADATEQNERTTLPIDEVTEVLKAWRRRQAIEVLNQYGEATFREIADAVAEAESGEDYDEDERKRVYVALYQSHIPKLDDYGVVEFHGTGNPVLRGPGFDSTVQYLRALQRVERGEDEGGGDDEGGPSRFRTLRDLL